MPATVRAALASAIPMTRDIACAALSETELAALGVALSAPIDDRRARPMLARTLGRAEQTLLAHQLARRETAH